MVLKAEDILRESESVGYQVTGGRELIGNGQEGPLSVTARNIETGQRHTTIVHTNGSPVDGEALGQPAEMAGITLPGDAG